MNIKNALTQPKLSMRMNSKVTVVAEILMMDKRTYIPTTKPLKNPIKFYMKVDKRILTFFVRSDKIEWSTLKIFCKCHKLDFREMFKKMAYTDLFIAHPFSSGIKKKRSEH